MNTDTKVKIAAVETKLAQIGEKRAELRQQYDEVLNSDEEYADYRERYFAYYQGEPMSIRKYYEISTEYHELNERIMAADNEEFERLCDKYDKRLAELERLLIA